jgi:hypothetical protein
MEKIREIAKKLVSGMVDIRIADMSADTIHSEAEEIGSWARPLALQVKVTRKATEWRCTIEISKMIEDGRLIESTSFVCGGANGPIRWDAVIEAIVDIAAPYGTH